MPKYRKKPVVIEAMQLTGEPPVECDLVLARIAGWLSAHGSDFHVVGDRRPFGLSIETLEGVMRADHGDYIIRGVQGEFYPCKPDIFEATYDPVITVNKYKYKQFGISWPRIRQAKGTKE